MPQDTQTNTRLAQKFIQHITRGCWPEGDSELDEAQRMISPDYEYQLLPKSLKHPPMAWPQHRDWLSKTIRGAGFTDFYMDIRRSTAQDDRVILEAVSRAIAKDGRSYSNEYRFAIMFSQDGKICKEEEFLDSLYVVEFLNQGNIKVLEHE